MRAVGRGDVCDGVAGGAGELADHLAQGADQRGQGVEAVGFAQDGVGGVRDFGPGAVRVELVQDGVDVQEQASDVPGVPGVQGDAGELVVAAGLADQPRPADAARTAPPAAARPTPGP